MARLKVVYDREYDQHEVTVASGPHRDRVVYRSDDEADAVEWMELTAAAGLTDDELLELEV